MATTGTNRYRGYDIVPMRQWSQWCVGIYATRADLPILPRSTLSTMAPQKEVVVEEAKQKIDRILAPELSEGLSNRELRDSSPTPRRPSEAPREALCAMLNLGDRSLRSPLWYGSPGRPPWPGLLATRVKFSGLRGAL
jgi:hypothetical protein